MKDKNFYMMVGVPGSGKSTWVINNTNFIHIVSSDAIIEDVASVLETTYSEVFNFCIPYSTKIVERKIKYLTENLYNVCLDQTNLTKKVRKEKLSLLNNSEQYKKTAVVCIAPSDEILFERINSRIGKEIPHDVIIGMLNRFQMPTIEEGFDEILVVKN